MAKDSFIAEMNQVYRNAEDLLCSSDCPCGLRLSVTDLNPGPVMPPDGGWEDGDGPLRMLRFETADDGPTKVSNCPNYLEKVFGGDEDKQWQYEEIFAKVEEGQVCSGICNQIDDEALDYFLFSNINDGVPT